MVGRCVQHFQPIKVIYWNFEANWVHFLIILSNRNGVTKCLKRMNGYCHTFYAHQKKLRINKHDTHNLKWKWKRILSDFNFYYLKNNCERKAMANLSYDSGLAIVGDAHKSRGKWNKATSRYIDGIMKTFECINIHGTRSVRMCYTNSRHSIKALTIFRTQSLACCVWNIVWHQGGGKIWRTKKKERKKDDEYIKCDRTQIHRVGQVRSSSFTFFRRIYCDWKTWYVCATITIRAAKHSEINLFIKTKPPPNKSIYTQWINFFVFCNHSCAAHAYSWKYSCDTHTLLLSVYSVELRELFGFNEINYIFACFTRPKHTQYPFCRPAKLPIFG